MNQRSKRSSGRKQNINSISVNTGGHTSSQNIDHSPVEVNIPKEKTSEELSGKSIMEKLKGLAKASPAFKEVEKTELPEKDVTEK
jgi:hypothetical protein